MDAKYCLIKATEYAKKKKALETEVIFFSNKLDEAFKANPRKYEGIYNALHSLNYESLSVMLEIRVQLQEWHGAVDDFRIFTRKNYELFNTLNSINRAINFWQNSVCDSKPVRFDGDIIITDPCYIRDNDEDNDFDWFEWAEKKGICRDTIYGDWSCTTYEKDSNKKLGNFCADSGMVCVLPLKEVLSINPNFDYHINRPWTTTLIKDFHGMVCFEVEEEKYNYEGEEETEYAVHVIGIGNINFYSTQTGL